MNQYYKFQCIHPFEDGNGRVGRLMYNALRLCTGLPWYTFMANEYHLYLQYLRLIEQDFKKEHAHMYHLE